MLYTPVRQVFFISPKFGHPPHINLVRIDLTGVRMLSADITFGGPFPIFSRKMKPHFSDT